MHLITTWFGTFLYENGIKEMILFPKNKEEIAKRLFAIEKEEILIEEEKISKKLKNFFVNEIRLCNIGGIYSEKKIDLKEKAIEFGYTKEFFHQCIIELARMKMKNSFSEDILIIQSIKAIDDYNEIINLLGERLHEWYGYHFPELEGFAKDNEYIKFVLENKREKILKESIGCSLEEEDIKAIRTLANSILQLYESKKNVEKYIEKKMEELCPNLTYLVGTNIGARLIALAGGLEKLAKMPSSTIQLLGAEKSLFRFMRGKGSPPKYGIIFQHSLIHSSPLNHRGKIARTLAGKISIAVKVDFYSKEFIADRLKEDLEKRIKKL